MKLAAAKAVIRTGLLLAGNAAPAQTWMQTGADTNYYWTSIASSADGTKLAAAAQNNGVWLSTNSGVNWAQCSSINASSVASSADGTKLVAAASAIYLSTNSGTAWKPVPNYANLNLVASSADGTKLLAAGNSPILVSTNSGATWQIGTNTTFHWLSLTISADGTKMAATAEIDGGPVFYSTNTGVTWQQHNFTGSQPYVASTADGKLEVADVDFYLSTNWGITWSTNSYPAFYGPIATSADGSVLVSVKPQWGLWTSTNFGVAWTSNSVPARDWTSCGSSADGTKLVAIAQLGDIENGLVLTNGGIWTLQTTPSPQLNLSALNGVLNFSWLVPSTSFVLQQCSDLTAADWTTLTNQPWLNVTNLQAELTFPFTNGNSFFRLISH